MLVDCAIVTEELPLPPPPIPSPAGARVSFTGAVRDHDSGQTVGALELQAHPQAEEFLYRAVEQAVAKAGDEQDPALQVFVRHAVGKLPVGQVVLQVVVDCAHRRGAFALSSEVVDEIKATVPLWKRQYLEDGTSHWIGLN